jgi:hypothetical protein
MQEYLAGTSPTDPSDYLRVQAVIPGNPVVIQFIAVAGKTYTCQYSDSLVSGTWKKLSDISAQATTGSVNVTDLEPANRERFYRLVTPAQP